MTAADKIKAARSIVAEFDESFFAHRKQFLRGALSEMADLADAQAQENARLRYVLEGVRGAIDTGRNEPLMIWRDQINIALGDAP